MRFTILLFLIVSFSCQNSKVNHLQVPTEIEKLVFDYVQAWSERDVDYITDNTYGAPFVLFLEDTTIFLNDFENEHFYGVFMETAHPIKFLDTVESTLKTKIELPDQIKNIINREKESYPVADYKEVKDFLLSR